MCCTVFSFDLDYTSRASRVPQARVGAKGRVRGCWLDCLLSCFASNLVVKTIRAAKPFRRKAIRIADRTACHETKPSIKPSDGASLTSPPPRPCFDTACSSQKIPKSRAEAAQARMADGMSPLAKATAFTATKEQMKKARLSLFAMIWLRMSVTTAQHRKKVAVATISTVASGASVALSVPRSVKRQM